MTPTETATILRQFNKWLRGNKDDPQLESREINQAINAAIEMIERLEAAEKERDALRVELNEIRYWTAVAHDTIKALNARIEAAENDAAHQKALAASALRVAEGWERKCGELRAKIEQMEKRLRLILEEPENTMSNSKALREMVRQARLALEESK